MLSEEIALKIIRQAVKAPSGHNTQPWMFKYGRDYIDIIPDFSKKLEVVDPQNRELYISIGCAVENTIMASAYFGFDSKIEFSKIENSLLVKIKLEKSDQELKNSLYPYISKRGCNRGVYKEKLIEKNLLTMIQEMLVDKNATIEFFSKKEAFEMLVQFILEANVLQVSNADFKKELVSWMRFSEKGAMQKGDGLYSACMGIPNLGSLIGPHFIQFVLNPKMENKRILKVMQNTPHFALFSIENDTPEGWIQLGRVFQRFGLLTTKLGISHSHLNMPCEVDTIREKMEKSLNLEGKTPLLLIRMGYNNPMPFSFRKNIEKVIVKDDSNEI